MKTTIYVMRHGETDFNLRGLIQGQNDSMLTENGIALTVITAKALQDVKFDRVISSPLKRAHDTAEIMLRENRVSSAAIETDDRLKEFSFGEWEGRSCKPTEETTELNNFYYRPREFRGLPGGESTAQVVARTREFLLETANDPQNDGKTLLITTHGGAMRALLQEVYGETDDFWHGGVPDNCTVNVIGAENGKLSLVMDDTIYYDPALSRNPYKKYR
ncbi:MAG: histidine phosphatase family protein [Oscillospiraceae bacterium]|nr:histidine phosphatase family protein [Oscillospiraceae bacterium]